MLSRKLPGWEGMVQEEQPPQARGTTHEDVPDWWPYAAEFPQRLAPCTDINITGKIGEPGSTTYPWTITFPGSPPVLPDPDPGSQLYHLAAVFLFGDQLTDIASFIDMGMFLIN